MLLTITFWLLNILTYTFTQWKLNFDNILSTIIIHTCCLCYFTVVCVNFFVETLKMQTIHFHEDHSYEKNVYR